MRERRVAVLLAALLLPATVLGDLRAILQKVAFPLAVRSSSLLEDNFGTSFAGKYDSHFCPNQGTAEQNLAAVGRRRHARRSSP